MAPVLVVPALAQMAMGAKPAAFAWRTASCERRQGHSKLRVRRNDHDALAPYANDASGTLDRRVRLIAQEYRRAFGGAGLLARGDERIQDGCGPARREEAAGR